MNELIVYRDDGPLARALGRVRPPVPALALVGAGALPLAVAAIGGLGWSRPAVIAWLVVVAGLSGGRAGGRLGWAVPPALRAAEYGGVLWLAGAAGADAAFVFLAAAALRHYDLIYRLRDRGATPPAWLNAVAGGWDGRLILACVLAEAGALRPGLFAAGAVLAVLTLAESAAGWRAAEAT